MALEVEDVGVQNQVCEDEILTNFIISFMYALKALCFATSMN
jgi:hypothetical protein